MRQITYHIHRYQQGRAFVQTFKFDYEPDRTILWGLQKIKDTQDPTLTFLAACRSAVCGACSIRVNGEAMLGCESKIDELTERYGTDELTIAPIGNFRVTPVRAPSPMPSSAACPAPFQLPVFLL